MFGDIFWLLQFGKGLASRGRRTGKLLNILIYTRPVPNTDYLLKMSIVPRLRNTELRKATPGQQRF